MSPSCFFYLFAYIKHGLNYSFEVDATFVVKFFEGTPIPTSLVLVIVLAVAAYLGHVGPQLWLGSLKLGPWLLHPLVLLFAISGTLMISKTLRIPKP